MNFNSQEIFIMEEWKWIQGCEGIHKVFFDGHIESDPAWPVVYGESSAGYIIVGMKVPSGCLNARAHRLVALAFCERPEGCDVVDHLDEVKSNNHALNLEWVTDAENLRRSRERRRILMEKELSRFSEEDVLLARKLWREGHDLREIRQLFSVYLTQSFFRNVVSGVLYPELPMIDSTPAERREARRKRRLARNDEDEDEHDF